MLLIILFIRGLASLSDMPLLNLMPIFIGVQWQILSQYLLYAIGAAGLVMLIFYWRLKWIRLENEMLLLRKRANQLTGIVEMKNRFFANISHELSTPMTPASFPIRTISSNVNDGEVFDISSTIQSNAIHVLQLVNQLIEVSKLEAAWYNDKSLPLEEITTRMHNLLNEQEKEQTNYDEELRRMQDFSQTKEKDNSFMKNIYAVIENMINDSQLGASKLAEKNAMSLRTLNRKLNAMTGLTAGDLIRQYRLQKSLIFLKAGHNVSEVAYMVGFETPAYFSQCFKDQYGVCPKDYFNPRQN